MSKDVHCGITYNEKLEITLVIIYLFKGLLKLNKPIRVRS